MIRVNGYAYCPVCVKAYGLDAQNPNGTDLVERDNKLSRVRLDCPMPDCHNWLPPERKRWVISAPVALDA